MYFEMFLQNPKRCCLGFIKNRNLPVFLSFFNSARITFDKKNKNAKKGAFLGSKSILESDLKYAFTLFWEKYRV
jgi:hypothetical protein